jgi:hypothetical protein
VNLATGAELGTAGGTLVLAIATFASIRSSQRAARISERALLAGLRPMLFPTRLDDPSEKVGFGDNHYLHVQGGRAAIDATDTVIYLAATLRNVGSGIAVLDRWRISAQADPGAPDPSQLSEFRRLTRDIYVASGDFSFWQGALRDPSDPLFAEIQTGIKQADRLVLELLYGDMEGGQRTISRFTFSQAADDSWLVALVRHFSLDREGPR